jgi:hypothetical protein
VKEDDMTDARTALVTIGGCACCDDRGVIEGTICGRCARKYGAGFARILGRVRHERDFAIKCFDALGARQRPLFLMMFGDPRFDAWPVRVRGVHGRPAAADAGRVIDRRDWAAARAR